MAERRAVLVGTGNIARHWVAALAARPDVAIVGVVEPDAARAEAFIAAQGLRCRRQASIERAVADEGADLAINLTPPALHRQIGEEALALGCDVFSEKPLAPSIEDGRALVAAAHAAGRQLVVMQNRRYHPAIVRLAQAVRDGAIGDPVLACADMYMAPHFPMEFVNAMAHPLLVDTAIHTFDQARFLTGRDAVRVHCVERDPGYSWFAGHAVATATFELEGGAVLSYRGSYVSPGFHTTWDSAWRLTGERGTLLWDGAGEPALEAIVPGERDGLFDPVARTPLPVAAPRDVTGHAAAIDDALDHLAAGRVPPTAAADNLRSLAMSSAALLSATEGRPVELAELG